MCQARIRGAVGSEIFTGESVIHGYGLCLTHGLDVHGRSSFMVLKRTDSSVRETRERVKHA